MTRQCCTGAWPTPDAAFVLRDMQTAENHPDATAGKHLQRSDCRQNPPICNCRQNPPSNTAGNSSTLHLEEKQWQTCSCDQISLVWGLLTPLHHQGSCYPNHQPTQQETNPNIGANMRSTAAKPMCAQHTCHLPTKQTSHQPLGTQKTLSKPPQGKTSHSAQTLLQNAGLCRQQQHHLLLLSPWPPPHRSLPSYW